MKAIIKYDYETDVLKVMPTKRKYDSSYQENNLVFDMDSKGKVVGLEVLDTSKVLGIPKRFLKNIRRVDGRIEVNKEELKLRIYLECEVRNSNKVSNYNVEKIKPEFLKPSSMDLALA